ncbi:MAG: hypothetical protein JNL58_18515 [Planctomyces sp.]|nr:hypothetical protein [Planctomyces sp.]
MFRSIFSSFNSFVQRLRGAGPDVALMRFDRHAAQLQKSFFELAANSGKPRGLRWVRCDWQEQRAIFTEPGSGLLTLVVGVSVAFEAIEGSDMENVAAAGDLRDASAVFHYQNGAWGTGGRVLFNMDPVTAAQRLGGNPLSNVTPPPRRS